MSNPAWIDGVHCDLSEAKVSIEDRGYLLGDGVYEVIRIYNRQPFYLSAHLERLERSAAAIRIKLPYTKKELESEIGELVGKSSYADGYIYMQLTRGSAKRDHLFPADVEPTLAMYVRDLPPLPDLEKVKPAACITVPDERWLNCYIKTTNLLPNLLARQKAHESAAIEALFYRPGGLLTEGTRSNLFAVLDGVVHTHPSTNLILPGITREIVIGLIQKLAIPFKEEAFKVDDIGRASEVWITSTTLEVQPIHSVDGTALDNTCPGETSLQLMKEFRNLVTEER